jgi:hypothetical protein
MALPDWPRLMTLPAQRTRALIEAYDLLLALANGMLIYWPKNGQIFWRQERTLEHA